MIRIMTAFTFLFLLTISIEAQVAVIRNCHQLKGSEFRFPIISIPNNVAASKRINDYLQMTWAERTILKTTEEKLFNDVKYVMDQDKNHGSLQSLSYEVGLNNSAVISLNVDVETMAAYPDFFQQGFTFNAATGDVILLEDLCTKEGLKNLQKYLLKQRIQLVNNHVIELSQDSSFYDLSADLDIKKEFSDCMTKYTFNDFVLLNDTILFSSPRCLPHAQQALDGDFSIKIPFKQLIPYLNSYGKKLLIDKIAVKEAFHQQLLQRPLYGTIGKIPIVMYFYQPYENEISGYYYYVSEGLKIDFWGERNKNHVRLTCHSDQNKMVDELIEGEILKNIFKGKWKKKIDGEKPLPLMVK